MYPNVVPFMLVSLTLSLKESSLYLCLLNKNGLPCWVFFRVCSISSVPSFFLDNSFENDQKPFMSHFLTISAFIFSLFDASSFNNVFHIICFGSAYLLQSNSPLVNFFVSKLSSLFPHSVIFLVISMLPFEPTLKPKNVLAFGV